MKIYFISNIIKHVHHQELIYYTCVQAVFEYLYKLYFVFPQKIGSHLDLHRTCVQVKRLCFNHRTENISPLCEKKVIIIGDTYTAKKV